MKLNLPRKYEIKKSTPEKFHKYKGKPKLSNSQKESFTDPQYTDSYILSYLLGVEDEGNFWAEFGSYCGTTLEYRMDNQKAKGKDRELLDSAFDYFNEKDIEVLKKADKLFPENTLYEREIVLDCGEFIIQGFIDCNFTKDKKEVVIDVKTAGKNSKKKGVEYYSSKRYKQVNLYAEALKREGNEIGYCGVVLLDRTFEGDFENPTLHLSGDIINIENAYNEKEAKKIIQEFREVAVEISKLKTTTDKLKQLLIEH